MDESPPDNRCSEDETLLVESLVLLDEAIRSGRDLSLDTLPFVLTETQQATWEAAKTCLKQLRGVQPPRLNFSPHFPEQVGRFHIERVLGVGGFGVVYLAHDPFLERHVVLKVPRPHALFSADERRRFVLEARAASQLDHRHIVTTFEAGETDGLPYIAYAYCEGPTLAEWIRQQTGPVQPRLAATIVMHLADAVSCSHQQGILHRDIKPGNVLLDPVKGGDQADFPFVAKLSDFGLAKLIEADLQATATSVMLGTPRYMAPEQTRHDQHMIGPATDVYGLGSVLYELLTKQPPFTAEATWDVLTQVREYAPAAPRLIVPDIPRDLEIIVLTCLEKDPADRYSTAAELNADLERFLNGEPIHARPTPPLRQLWMWCARHRLIAGLSGAIIASVILLFTGMLIHLMQTAHLSRELKNKNQSLTDTVQQLNQAVMQGKSAREVAEKHARELSETLYSIEVARAAEAWRRGDLKTMAAALQPFATQPDLYEFGWRYLWRQQSTKELFRTTMPKPQYFAQFTPDGQKVAFAGADSIVRIHALDDYRILHKIDTEQREINGLTFDPKGKWMATAGDDGSVAVWDLPEGTRRARYDVFKDAPAYQVDYSPAHQWLVVCGNSPEIQLIDLRRGERLPSVTDIHSERC